MGYWDHSNTQRTKTTTTIGFFLCVPGIVLAFWHCFSDMFNDNYSFFRWVPGIVLTLWYCFWDMFNGCKKESVVGTTKVPVLDGQWTDEKSEVI
uniref:Uncharacterized protein n=1 Tax=Globodera rostochiensis TaxID=31243 RepID=A0A914IGE7_GLORO